MLTSTIDLTITIPGPGPCTSTNIVINASTVVIEVIVIDALVVSAHGVMIVGGVRVAIIVNTGITLIRSC